MTTWSEINNQQNNPEEGSNNFLGEFRERRDEILKDPEKQEFIIETLNTLLDKNTLNKITVNRTKNELNILRQSMV